MNKKRVVCFGDSNTWGYDAQTKGRFDDNTRWTQVAQRLLGEDYMMIEEGLCGRTTVFTDPLGEWLRGLDYLYPCLISHSPIDLLVIMLGTNDTKERLSANATNIHDGLDRLVQCAKAAPVWHSEVCVLIIAPITIDEKCYSSAVSGEMGIGSVEKSRELPVLMRDYAQQSGCAFLDCNHYSNVNQIDFMHLDAAGHAELGKAVAAKVTELLSK